MGNLGEQTRRLLDKAFNLSILEKSRLAWVDYLKGLAIILVVYRHVMIGIGRSGVTIPPYIRNANEIFYSFRMALFFLLSGIFIQTSLAKRSIRQVFVIKLDNLLYPYFIWATLQITLQIVLSRYTNSDRTWIDYTYLFYQPRNLDQFWYLPALFNASAFYLLLKTIGRDGKGFVTERPWLHLGIGLILYFTAPYVQAISMLSDWMSLYIFFALGDILSKYFFEDRVQRFLRQYWLLFALIPVFGLSQWYYITHTVSLALFLGIALIGCLFLLVIAFRLQAWNSLSFLRVLGYHSLYIYVMHVLVAAFTRMILMKVFGIHNVVILLLGGIAMGVTIPVIIYNLFIFEKPGWWLFSFRKSKKRAPAPPSAPAAPVTLQNQP